MAVLVRRLTSGEAETLVGRSVAAKKVEEVVENGTRFAEVAVAKKANRDGASGDCVDLRYDRHGIVKAGTRGVVNEDRETYCLVARTDVERGSFGNGRI